MLFARAALTTLAITRMISKNYPKIIFLDTPKAQISIIKVELSDKKRSAIQASGLCGIRTGFSLFQRFVLCRGRRRLVQILSPFVRDQRFQGLRRVFWRDRAKRPWRWLKTCLPSLTVLKPRLLLFLFLRGYERNELCLTYQEITKKRFITIMGTQFRLQLAC